MTLAELSKMSDVEVAQAAIRRQLGPPPFVDAPDTTRDILSLLNAMKWGYTPTMAQSQWIFNVFVAGVAQLERLAAELAELKESLKK